MTSFNLKKGQSPPPILSNLCIGRRGFGFEGKHLEILLWDLSDSWVLCVDAWLKWLRPHWKSLVSLKGILSLTQRMFCRVLTDFSDPSRTFGLAEAPSMNLVMVLLLTDRLGTQRGPLVRLNPSKTLSPNFHQGLMLIPEHDNPWKLPVGKWWLVRHLKLAIHKCYAILKIASSPLHNELLTEQYSWYPGFISDILKCLIWHKHPV